jgi:hypothetical protein
MTNLASATPGPSPSGARLTGDDTQHAVAWYHALRALDPRAQITSVAVEAASAGNVDDVVVQYQVGPADYLQVKASAAAGTPATVHWLMANTPTGGPGILRKFHQAHTAFTAAGRPGRLQLITTRSMDPSDPVLTLRDRNDRVAERLRRASSPAAAAARRALAHHLGVDEEQLCSFLDHLRIRTDASEATWREHITHLALALGLRHDEAAFRLGVSEVREWVKTSRVEKTPGDIAQAVNRLGLRAASPWNVLVIQALDREHETSDAAVVLDWVDLFQGDEARTRRGLISTESWNTTLRPELAQAERSLASDTRRVLVRGMARLPVWFAAGAQLPRTRGYHVAQLHHDGQVWSSDLPLPSPLPPIKADTLRTPVVHEDIALSIAIAADPTEDVARYLTTCAPETGHIRLALQVGPGSQAITDDTHAWGAAMAIRDEVRRITAQFRPAMVHLFLATPAGLALLLGHLWDRMPDTQTYEDLGVRGYQPAFLIPN